MPLISSFYGILVYMYKEENAKHKTPHIHAAFGEDELVVDFEGNILAGKMPSKKEKIIQAWLAIHEDELKASWKALTENGEVIKIKGLE